MFEQEYEISRLITRHLRQELSVEETEALHSWLEHSPANQSLFRELTTEETLLADMRTFHSANKASVWTKTMQKVQQSQSPSTHPKTKLSVFHRYKYLTVAASLLLITGLVLYRYKAEITNTPHIQFSTDIAPGQNTATLTLANGKKIILSDVTNGEIANEAGVKISKTESGQLVYELKESKKEEEINYNTLTTARGEQYQVILPDGSHVWLNAATSITYPETFTSLKERKVILSGEAYFEVAKRRDQLFCVTTKNQKVEVIGTHFNINSYDDESASKTTLLEGLVKVNGTTFLKPNEQAIVKESHIDVVQVTAEAFIDWKEGVFAFKQEDLRSVMRKISRWYDVEVIYQLTTRDSQTYTGTISRSDHVSKVLNVLGEIGGLKFRIEGKKIIVAN